MISTNLSIPQVILRFSVIIIALMIIGTTWQSPWISSFTLWWSPVLILIVTRMISITLWGPVIAMIIKLYIVHHFIHQQWSSTHVLILSSSSLSDDQYHLRSCNSASSKATLAYCLYQLVTQFCAIFCSKFFLCFSNYVQCSCPYPLIISLMISTTWRSCNRHKHQRVHQRPAL